jgi:hypothetical protein
VINAATTHTDVAAHCFFAVIPAFAGTTAEESMAPGKSKE